MHRSIVVRLVLIAGLILPTTALLSATPASAARMTCNISHTTTVSPGLEQPPGADPVDAVQSFRLTATLSGCTGSPAGSGITGGTAIGTLKSISPQKPRCSDLTTNGSTIGTVGNIPANRVHVTWNNPTGPPAVTTIKVLLTISSPLVVSLSGPTFGPYPPLASRAAGGRFGIAAAQGSCTDASPVTKLSGSGTITLT